MVLELEGGDLVPVDEGQVDDILNKQIARAREEA